MAKRQAPNGARRAPSPSNSVAASKAAARRAPAHYYSNEGRMLGVRASYEAAGSGKRAKNKFAHTNNASIKYLLGTSQPVIVKRCRYAIRNNPIANAIVEFITGTTVGMGIRPRITDETLLALWNEWVEEADADGLDDFYMLQALAMREIVATGECFIRIRPRRREDGLPVPLQVQVLPSEFVPFHDDQTRGVVSGIQLGGIGDRLAYMFHKTHPGDGAATHGHDYSEVPADRVCHVFDRREGGQIRGEPWLVRAIIRLQELDEYEDAELVKKNFSARITSFFKRKSPVDPNTGMLFAEVDEEGESDLAEVIENPEAGSGLVLPDDYDVEFAPTHKSGSEFPHFVRQVLSEACVGLAPVDLILDRDIPERSQQLTLAKYETTVLQRRRMLIHKFCRPVWRAFLDAAVASGRWNGNPEDFYRVKWTGQPLPKIRRHQEAQADVIEMRSGTVSMAEIVERKGADYAEHIKRLAQEAKDRADNGLVLTIDPRHVSNAGVSQANDFDDEEDPENGDS